MANIHGQLTVDGKTIYIGTPDPNAKGIRVFSMLGIDDQSEIHIILVDGEGNKDSIDWGPGMPRADYDPKQ